MTNPISKSNPLLDRKGRPATGPKVVMRSEAYASLMSAARAGIPEETVGALVGKIYRPPRRPIWITIEDIVPLELEPAGGLGLTVSREGWGKLKSRLQDAPNGALRILGWFYADPGLGLFRPRVDVAEVQQALAADLETFLLVNPSADRGGFYISHDGALEPA